MHQNLVFNEIKLQTFLLANFENFSNKCYLLFYCLQEISSVSCKKTGNTIIHQIMIVLRTKIEPFGTPDTAVYILALNQILGQTEFD